MNDTAKRLLIHLIKEETIAKSKEVRRQHIRRFAAAVVERGQEIQECVEAIPGV